MKGFSEMHPILDAFEVSPAGVTVKATTAPQAFSYPAGATFVKVQATGKVYVSLDSTGAHVPLASISATTGSTGRQYIISDNKDQFFQLEQRTTSDKFSVVASTLLSAKTAIFHFYGTGA